MKFQLINGHFTPQDALALLTQMTHAKVSHHERQINASDNEEDIKSREKRIKDLQRELHNARHYIATSGQQGVSLQADIILTVS